MNKTQRGTRPAIRSTKRRTTDAVEILDGITGRDAGLRRLIQEADANLEIAQMIHDARAKAGLTQAELARLVGTTQSVICRLEDADYEGHSLTMLRRIARAVGKRVELRLVPEAA
jgi:DNA-binding XRE family transcriptional regulator